jgi:hypothetical protein
MKGKVQKGVRAHDEAPTDIYAGANSNVAKEAKNKAEGFKRGGKAHKAKHHMEKIHGAAAKAHAGRKPRKSGGGVLSSAARGTMRPGFEG